MKKSFITYAVSFIPLTSYANSSPQGGGMSLLEIIVIVVILLLIFAVIWIVFDIRRKNKKNEEQRNRKGGKKLIDKNRINENIDLKKTKKGLEEEIAKKNKEIASLKNKLTVKDNEIASLKKQIMESISSSSRRSMSSTDSNKQDDNNENTNVDANNNSNPLVGQPNYNELAVINGNLVKAETEQTTYYRAWREKGLILFEFVNNDRTRKAINNRTIIIEPFCMKLESSKSPDTSEEIETKTPGILNDDYTLRKKAEIIYK